MDWSMLVYPVLLLAAGLVGGGTATKQDSPPVTRDYVLNISRATISPDGFEREVILANGMFPGPTIRGTLGDHMRITVINSLDQPTAVHWHGLRQFGTGWADGAAGVSHCPIPPGQEVTYRFTLQNTGTYWWHAHYLAQRVDGLSGAFIVDPPEDEVYPHKYDGERILMVTDWYHQNSSILSEWFLSDENPEGIEPVPDSGLINNRGRYNCSRDVLNGTCRDDRPLGLTYDVVPVTEMHTYRIRLINSAAMAMFHFSIDGHNMTVIEVDGVTVAPVTISRLSINAAQRYSVLVTASERPGLYWIRADLQTSCFDTIDEYFISEVLGILQYRSVALALPTSSGYTDDDNCTELTSVMDQLHPLPPRPVPQNPVRFTLDFDIDTDEDNKSRAYINNITYVNPPPSVALLNLAKANVSIPSRYNPLVLTEPGATVDFIINNRDDGEHPFHLHGHHFAVLGTGEQDEGSYTGQPLLDQPNDNPLWRDTISINATSWAYIRFVADNPGVWPFHCHIAWHVEAGLLLPVVELPQSILPLPIPPAFEKLCVEAQRPVVAP